MIKIGNANLVDIGTSKGFVIPSFILKTLDMTKEDDYFLSMERGGVFIVKEQKKVD